MRYELKARATELGSRPDMVGSMGNSSGGHQAMLLGMRPFDARYGALPLLRWRPRQPGSTYRKYASPAAIGRRLAAGPFSSL
jgi:acetyl esterase/lipase